MESIHTRTQMLIRSLRVHQNYKEKHSLPPLTAHSQPQLHSFALKDLTFLTETPL